MKVLVIDDEKEILRSLQTYLSLRDYEVITAETACEGRELYSEEDVKLVLLDINMPDESGLVLLRELKNLDHTTEVIMITGYNSLNKTLEARELGATEYLLKPFSDMDEVGEVVDQAAKRIQRWQDALEDGLREKRRDREESR